MTSTPRPDVAGIKARVKHAGGIFGLYTEDIPALITYIEALEERMGKLEAVVKAARVLRKPLYNFFGFGFDIYLHDDKTWSGDCTPEQARAEFEKCDAAQSKLKNTLAALDSPEEQKAMEAGDGT